MRCLSTPHNLHVCSYHSCGLLPFIVTTKSLQDVHYVMAPGVILSTQYFQLWPMRSRLHFRIGSGILQMKYVRPGSAEVPAYNSDFCPFKFSGCESWQLLVMSVYLEYILARLTGFLCHVCFWVSRSLKKRFTVSKRDFTLTFLFPRKKGIITSCQPYENIDLRDKNSAIRAKSATKSLNQYVLLLNVD